MNHGTNYIDTNDTSHVNTAIMIVIIIIVIIIMMMMMMKKYDITKKKDHY